MQLEILTVQQMYEADRLAISNVGSSYKLMQNAVTTLLDSLQSMVNSSTGILILCGRGNNGGDGLLLAAQLDARGYAVEVLFCGSDLQWSKITGDAELARNAWLQQNNSISFLADIASDGINNFLQQFISDYPSGVFVIDAIFGAGLSRNIEEPVFSLIKCLNEIRGKSADGKKRDSSFTVASIDLPSGINGNTGNICGIAMYADLTISFFRKKPAHILQPGKNHCGKTVITDIGIPDSVLAILQPDTISNAPELWKQDLVFPDAHTHKYTRGHTLVVSGPKYATGAARLAAMAALRAGAGVVTIASAADAMAINAAHCTEIMLCQIDGTSSLMQALTEKRVNSIVIGPGFGVGQYCRDLTLVAIQHCPVVVLDADAITSFSSKAGGNPEILFNAIASSQATVVLTPHEGEFQRLFGHHGQTSDSNGKLQVARESASTSGAIVVYKGADTVIASPCGRCVISDNGAPWLATAGSGDILAGTVAGLLGQKIQHQLKHGNSLNTVAAAVWLHSEASAVLGPGMIAGDLPLVYPQLLKAVYESSLL